MEFIHPKCLQIQNGIFSHESYNKQKCDPQLPEITCSDQHITEFITWKETYIRRDLQRVILNAFSQYSEEEVQNAIYNIPMHINSQFAILRAVTFGCHFPAYNLNAMSEDDTEGYSSNYEDYPLSDNHDPDESSYELDTEANDSMEPEIEDHGIELDEAMPGPSGLQVAVGIRMSDDDMIIGRTYEIDPTIKNCAYRRATLQPHHTMPESVDSVNRHTNIKRKLPEAIAGPSSKVPCTNANSDSRIIIIDPPNPDHVRKLVNTLAEMFPDCQIEHLNMLCKDKEYNNTNLDSVMDILLFQDYPRKVEEEAIDFETQLEIMINVLPDADPEYLSNELGKMENNDQLKQFISMAIEKNQYPKLADVNKKKQALAQVRQYTSDFDAEEFLKLIPDPETYFDRKTFRAEISNPQKKLHMNYFFRNYFNRISVRQLGSVLEKHKTFFEALDALERCKQNKIGIIANKRREIEFHCDDIPLLQLFTYVQHKDLILETQNALKERALERKKVAISNKEVNTCACCFDEEVMLEDTFICSNGCVACKDCIKRSTEIIFAENGLKFPCLVGCGTEYSLETLQSCVSPKVFCKIAKRKQLEEVKAAGLEDLEICPFCDFAAIPAADDKIFKCFNPECMKETCRLCKEPSHIPLRCNEVEKDADVKQRVFVENEMTEALMRKCLECDLKFIKSDGCNKITCQCGATMCYICNKPGVDYSHFNGQGGQEYHKCPLYSNTELLHEQAAINGGLQAKRKLGVESLKVDPLVDANQRIDLAKKTYQRMPGQPE